MQRIDAITAAPLHPQKHVEISSPDGARALFYNTSTLIRICREKGALLMPPHFREPMEKSLVEKIVKIDGSSILHTGDQAPVVAAIEQRGTEEHARLKEVMHAAMAEELLSQFISLSKKELFICPTCYAHLAKKREQKDPRKYRHIPEKDRIRIFCPLSLLADLHVETQLPFVVFLSAAEWKAHVRKFHAHPDQPAREHRLRDLVNQHLAFKNQLYFNTTNYEKRRDTTQRYWTADAKYNTMRYNRIVLQLTELLEAFRKSETTTRGSFSCGVAFDDLPLPKYEVWGPGEDANFIVDDDVCEEEERERAEREKDEKRRRKEEKERGSTPSKKKLRVEFEEDDDEDAQLLLKREVDSLSKPSRLSEQEMKWLGHVSTSIDRHFDRHRRELGEIKRSGVRSPDLSEDSYEQVSIASESEKDGQIGSSTPRPASSMKQCKTPVKRSMPPNTSVSNDAAILRAKGPMPGRQRKSPVPPTSPLPAARATPQKAEKRVSTSLVRAPSESKDILTWYYYSTDPDVEIENGCELPALNVGASPNKKILK